MNLIDMCCCFECKTLTLPKAQTEFLDTDKNFKKIFEFYQLQLRFHDVSILDSCQLELCSKDINYLRVEGMYK
jgi:hypothetical protein